MNIAALLTLSALLLTGCGARSHLQVAADTLSAAQAADTVTVYGRNVSGEAASIGGETMRIVRIATI